MRKPIILAILFIIFSCDDPSLDSMDNTDDGVFEPIEELTLLSSIEIATNNPTNIADTYNFSYNNSDLLTAISSTNPDLQQVTCFYSNSNRLEQLDITNDQGTITTTQVSTGISGNGESFISLSFTDDMNNVIEKRLFTDSQNRIDRSITTSTDPSGSSTFVSDFRFEYTQNFNVTRINQLNESGIVIAFTEFTYNFNNNPFKDMNDIIRFELFDTFNPYSRNLPATREDYTVTLNNGTILDQSIQYTYQLNADGFPIQRELLVTQTGVSTTYFEFFNYLP